MHSRRLALVALVLVGRWIVGLAPIVGCAVLAYELRTAPPPIVMTPSDPSPRLAETAQPTPPPALTKPAPSADALTTSLFFSEVQMATPKVGWAWGDTSSSGRPDGGFSRTDDGGRTWVEVGPVGCAHFARGPQDAWVATCDSRGGRVHFTNDGGKTWSYAGEVSADQRSAVAASNLQFPDTAHGFVELTFGLEGEDTSLFRTSDGGRSWHEVGSASWDATTSFVDARRGWRASNAHTLDRTTDGGATWTTHPDLAACAIDMVPSFEGREGIVLGNCPSGWRVFHTTDGGERWVAGAKVEVNDPGFAVHGGNQAWLWSGQASARTNDGGRSLDALGVDTTGASFQIVSASRGFMMSDADDDLVISRTNDGGRTFSAVLTTPASTTRGFSFSDPDHGVFFTSFDSGTRVMSTSDGGRSWQFLR